MTPPLLLKFLANFHWSTLPKRLLEVEQEFAPFLDLKITLQETAFINIKWTGFPGPVYLDDEWFHANCTDPAYDIAALALNETDWQAKDSAGWHKNPYNGCIGLEIRAYREGQRAMNGKYLIEMILIHEISHALFQMANWGQSPTIEDQTHNYLALNNPKFQLKECMSFLDFNRVNNYLNMNKIKIRQIGWSDAEKGLYIPFDTPEKLKAVLAKFTELFPDYQLDPNEINLGKRPF